MPCLSPPRTPFRHCSRGLPQQPASHVGFLVASSQAGPLFAPAPHVVLVAHVNREDRNMITEGTILFALASLIGGIFWGGRLEGRVNSVEQRHEDLKDYLQDILDAKFAGMVSRLERIERSVNGHAHKD